jgi:RimJ/RimL family protein N-acetyltransferase
MKKPSDSATRLLWRRPDHVLEARRGDAALVEQHADALLGWYNDPSNASMMGGSGTMTRADVIDFWRELGEGGGHGYLSFVDGALVGDMDLRGISEDAGGAVAEFAIMIGDRTRQGAGLGRSFALMLHVHAFRDLGLTKLYVPPRRENARVHRLNDWLGYSRDDGEAARSYADEEGCVTSSLDGATLRRLHPEAWTSVEAALR